jgi:hypothetical protein
MSNVRLLVLFDNGFLRFELPDGWHVEENEEGTVFATDPTDAEIRISVEVGGIRTDERPIDAREFLSRAYADKLTNGAASLAVSAGGRAFAAWHDLLEHEGISYHLAFVQIAKSQTENNLQLARFQLAVPASKAMGERAQCLRAFTEGSAKAAHFYEWPE